MDRLRILWVRTSLKFQNTIIGILRGLLFRPDRKPAKILVFRTGSIGDSICALPAMVAIRQRFAGSEIHLLTDEGAQKFASLSNLLSKDYYDYVFDYSNLRPGRLLSALRKAKYDLVIELPQNIATLGLQIRDMIFFRLAGIRSGFGWHITTCFTFLQSQERNLHFLSETNNLLSILRTHDVMALSTIDYPLNITTGDATAVEKVLPDSSSPWSRRKIIAVVPGAKRSQNRYPFDRFVLLVNWLVQKNYSVAIVGGLDDVMRGEELEKIPGVRSFCGILTPTQSAVLLSKCSMTISNDTGPMHLSYAVGTPVIGLFSSRDFQEKWFPPEENGAALRNYHVHCSMCFSETCSNNICMQGIPLQEVKDAFLQLESRLK